MSKLTAKVQIGSYDKWNSISNGTALYILLNYMTYEFIISKVLSSYVYNIEVEFLIINIFNMYFHSFNLMINDYYFIIILFLKTYYFNNYFIIKLLFIMATLTMSPILM